MTADGLAMKEARVISSHDIDLVILEYRKVSNIRFTKYQDLDVSRLIL